MALLAAILTGLLHPRRPEWDPTRLAPGEVLPVTLRTWTGPIVWLDARGEASYRRGHVPGAVLLNEENWSAALPGLLARWDPEQRWVVYCSRRGCGPSREVARRLREEVGIGNVFVLKGGFEAWQESSPVGMTPP